MYLISFLYHFKINIVKKDIILNSLVQENLLILSKSYNLKLIKNDYYLQKNQLKVLKSYIFIIISNRKS